MHDLLALLAFPFLAAIVFVGMHTWLGLQVLRRKVVFADLALAQLSALGGTVAVAVGHAPGSLAGFGYALLLTIIGAGFLTLTRQFSRQVSQEAVIGIVYVVATAVTVLVVDRSPQGAEHVKRMLVGSILTVGPEDVVKLAALYGAIGLLHFLLRRPLIAAAHDEAHASGRWTAVWDFVFYCTFGVVVTSSVAIAGVLLVFSFLIIPAVIGFLFSARMGLALGHRVGGRDRRQPGRVRRLGRLRLSDRGRDGGGFRGGAARGGGAPRPRRRHARRSPDEPAAGLGGVVRPDRHGGVRAGPVAARLSRKRSAPDRRL